MGTLTQVEFPPAPAPAIEDATPAITINPWLIAFTVMLATFMEVLDTSIANVALPHIAGSLSAGVDESTWVLTSYLVANAIVLPLTGWLSSLFGRKRFYMACVLIFVLSSLLCGLAPTLPLLVFFRVLQGAGGGGLQPVSQAILVESFPRAKQGMAMAVYGMGVVVAPIIGPTLGGWITDNYTWRWIFFINIPVGLLSIILTSMLIADPPHLSGKKNQSRLRIDYIGLAFLSVGLGFLQVVLDKGQRDDWFASHFITWCAAASAIGLIGAVAWELRQKEPIIELHLFKDRNYAVAIATMFILGVVLYGTTVLLPVMLQTLMGYTAQLSGLVLSPGAILTMITLPICGRLLAKYPPSWLVMVGMFCMALGMFALARLNLYTSFPVFVFVWMISRGSLGFLFVPINVSAFAFVPKERMNSATGMINLARNIGGSVGISLVTTWQTRFAQRHQMRLIENYSPLNPNYNRAVHGLAALLHSRGSDMITATKQAQSLLYYELQRQADMLAFNDVYWLLGVLCFAVLPFMFFRKRATAQIFSSQQERMLGDIQADLVEDNYHAAHDEQFAAHINTIAARVQLQFPGEQSSVHIILIDTPEANSFSVGPERIYITRKMVALLRNDDELAGLLGHELSHAMTHQNPIIVTQLFREILGVNAVSDRKDILEKLSRVLDSIDRNPKLLSKTSEIMQKQEKLHQNEADRVALYASAAAGFSPRAYLELFERSEGTNGSSGSVLTDYFGATPSNLRRLREIQKTLRQLPRSCREMVPVASSAFRTWQAVVLSNPDLARR